MRDENRPSLTITEFADYWKERERQAYRAQKEFRELWPEFETPNDLARQILSRLEGDRLTTEIPDVPLSVLVDAAMAP